MRSAGIPIEALIEYMTLFRQGKKTVTARKQLLLDQREVLLKKQEEIKNTIKRLNYKIEVYNDIEAGKRNDFMEEP